jgi:hypothetical protein
MTAKYSELQFLNDIWRIIDYMCLVPENEKDESAAFKKVFRMIQTVYPTKFYRKLTSTKGVTTMAKEPMNQHKRMAEGEKITGMKKGGKVKEGSKKEEAKESKKFEKKEDKKMACGGMMKKGGKVKKGKK